MVKFYIFVIGVFVFFGSVKVVIVGLIKYDLKFGLVCFFLKVVQSVSLYIGLEEGIMGI